MRAWIIFAGAGLVAIGCAKAEEALDVVPGSGGGTGTGGEISTGGVGTGGDVTTGGSESGGDGSGGAPTGGAGMGGGNTGGVSMGGVTTGGRNTGGRAVGGTGTGGVPTGGVSAGGAPTGGVNAGGANLGGANLGGVPTGGVETGGTGGVIVGDCVAEADGDLTVVVSNVGTEMNAVSFTVTITNSGSSPIDFGGYSYRWYMTDSGNGGETKLYNSQLDNPFQTVDTSTKAELVAGVEGRELYNAYIEVTLTGVTLGPDQRWVSQPAQTYFQGRNTGDDLSQETKEVAVFDAEGVVVEGCDPR